MFAAWRQVRLRAVEDVVLARLGQGEVAPGLPSLATLLRYRARIERDTARTTQELLGLHRRRTEIADPMRLRWLAQRIEEAQAIAAAFPPAETAAENGMSEPAPIAAVGSAFEKCTNELPIGTNEPTAANELPPDMNEPGHPMRPLSEGWSDTPGVARLNRHQRRRLAALQQRAA